MNTQQLRELLEDRRWRLMNNFGYSAFSDGLTLQAIAEIDNELARLLGTTEE